MKKNNILQLSNADLRKIIKETVWGVFKTHDQHNEIDIVHLFHLNDVPEEELEKQYIDLSFTVSSAGYGGKFMGARGKILKEEATSTLSVEETKKELQKKFRLKDWQFALQDGANGVKLVVLYPGILRNTRLIQDAMSACGWSLSTKGFIWYKKMLWRAMSFDPVFQKDVSNEARRFPYLFHWSPAYNLNAIMANGLTPRSENKLFSYPDRVHLIKGNAPKEDIMSIGGQLNKTNKQKKNDGDYVLFAVDLSKIPDTVEIYYDPRYDWGYYVKEPLPPTAVKPIFRFNFQKMEERPLK